MVIPATIPGLHDAARASLGEERFFPVLEKAYKRTESEIIKNNPKITLFISFIFIDLCLNLL